MKKTLILGMLFILLVSTVFVAAENTGTGKPEVTGSEMTGAVPPDNKSNENSGQEPLIAMHTETQEQNMGEETQLKNEVKTQERMQDGEFTSEDGRQIKVRSVDGTEMKLNAGSATAATKMQLTQEQTALGTKLKTTLSNGKDAEVKVMPDVASEKAIEQLKLKVCTEDSGCMIELKEVGVGDSAKLAYEVLAQKEARVLGIFKANMNVDAQVDAETGEIISKHVPWWSFVATK